MFARLMIAAKIAAVTALLCVMAGGALWYASSRSTGIGARYDRFVAQENRGFAESRNATRSVFEIGYALDRALMTDGTVRLPSLVQIDAALARLRRIMAELPAQVPAFSSRIATQAGTVERFLAESLAARRMIEAGETARAAAHVRQVVDPLMRTLAEHLGGLTDDIVAAVADETATLAAETHAAQTTTLALGLGAVAAGFVLAMVVSAIDGIAGSIREISVVSASIAAAVEEQDAATQEIVRNVCQAATGTGEVTGHIGGVADAAEGTGRTTNQVLTAASGLSHQSDRLSAEVRRFVETIRAA